MSYDDECPPDWSTYDRAATAAADLRFLLFEMQAGTHVSGSLVFMKRIGDVKPNREDLLAAMGPQNYARAREYLDCVDANLKRMGSIALSLTLTAMTQSIDPAVAPILGRVQSRISAGDVNGAWNLMEAWSCGREIPAEEDDEDDRPQGGAA